MTTTQASSFDQLEAVGKMQASLHTTVTDLYEATDFEIMAAIAFAN